VVVNISEHEAVTWCMRERDAQAQASVDEFTSSAHGLSSKAHGVALVHDKNGQKCGAKCATCI
jgi:hypothetical protein